MGFGDRGGVAVESGEERREKTKFERCDGESESFRSFEREGH